MKWYIRRNILNIVADTFISSKESPMVSVFKDSSIARDLIENEPENEIIFNEKDRCPLCKKKDIDDSIHGYHKDCYIKHEIKNLELKIKSLRGLIDETPEDEYPVIRTKLLTKNVDKS